MATAKKKKQKQWYNAAQCLEMNLNRSPVVECASL